MGHKPGIGAIFGIVTEEGVVKPESPVVLLDRENKKIVRRQNTDANGGFTFNGLNDQEATYMVFATDEDGADPKNALIQDRILPVPAYSGATLWSNWEYMARQKNALMVWSGDYSEYEGNIYPNDSQVGGSSQTVGAASRYIAGIGSVHLAVDTPPAGAPHIPLLHIVNRALVVGAPHNFYVYSSPTDPYAPAAHSVEAVVVLSSVVGTISMGGTPASKGDHNGNWAWDTEFGHRTSGAPSPPSRLDYVSSTRTLSITYKHGVGVHRDASWATLVPAAIGTLVTRSHVFPEGGVPTGPVHIAYTLTPGVSLVLYVNGAEVHTWDLVGEASYLCIRGFNSFSPSFSRGGFIWAGAPNADLPLAISEAVVGPYAFYPYTALTATEVLEQYEALMTPSLLPRLTGYMREVITDRPICYVRLDDLATEIVQRNHAVTDFIRGDFLPGGLRTLSMISEALITPEQSSPVVGGMSMEFSGGYIQGNTFARSSNSPRGFTIDFLVQPVETPGALERIVRVSSTDTASIQVSIDSDRRLSVYALLFGGGSETMHFAHVLSFTEFSHVGIVVDKDQAVATLYINGIPVESLTTSGTPLVAYVAGWDADVTGRFFIAGSTSGDTTFKGKLCEVAFYGRALSASRVLAHYNARLVP